VRLLLDTHVLLWAASEPETLSDEARESLADGANDVLVSAVSGWELAIKQSLGKLILPRPVEQWLPEVLRRTGFSVAEVSLAAALRVRALPWHHRDPFDRLLVAQAAEGGFTLVTRDQALERYGVPTLRA
jgi:PIN domain nuclease of toxin-antitoxin system